MPRISKQFVVHAPADRVWELIGPGFDRIGDWATAIPTSTALLGVAPISGAPVAGRTCTTGLALVPEVNETLVAYDPARRSLTYEGSGLPAFVALARNTWTVSSLDDRSCRVSLDARLDTRGALAWLLRMMLLVHVARVSRHLADDLRHLAEHGTVSPRKQRRLRRRSTGG
jgi:hypothetical protein